MYWLILHYALAIQPCEYEDGSEMVHAGQMCIWDAQGRTNHLGDSYIAVRDKDGTFYYFYADRHTETMFVGTEKNEV